MHFPVKPAVKTPATEAAIRAMAWSANEAWEAIRNPAWMARQVQ